MNKNISFIIPAKNEYENLKKLIPYLIKFFENKNFVYEIIYRFNKLNDNLKIVEIPTIHQKREFGKSKKRHFYYLINMMNLLIELNRE